MAVSELPDPNLLRQLIDYEPLTGSMVWRARLVEMFTGEYGRAGGARPASWVCNRWNANFAGKPALATIMKDGYLAGNIFRRQYKAHRIAWAVYYGEAPKGFIDHIDGNPANNAIDNLRLVNHAGNMRNTKKPCTNKSGAVGVWFDKGLGKWTAYIGSGGRKRHIGVYEEKSDAITARKEVEKQLGFHENHGR